MLHSFVLPTKTSAIFLSVPEIPRLKVVHDDQRRTIREATLPQADGTIRRVTSIAIKAANDGKPIVLGNHYHDIPEYFTILDGSPTVITAPLSDPDAITERTYDSGAHLVMQPLEAHAFIFPPEGGELRSTMDASFEAGGTHPHKISQ